MAADGAARGGSRGRRPAVAFPDVFNSEFRDYLRPRRDGRGCCARHDPLRARWKERPAGEPVEPSTGLGLMGLALSGGGIRSAAFQLGLLQALARDDRLRCFDYLSTVSGGGYLGTCLTSALTASGGVERGDFPFRYDGRNESPLVRHLRNHGQYLAPGHGPYRGNVGSLVAMQLSGLVLNLTAVVGLLGLLAGGMLLVFRWVQFPLAVVLGDLVGVTIDDPATLWTRPWETPLPLFLPAIGFALLGVLFALAGLSQTFKRWTIANRRRLAVRQGYLLVAVGISLVFALLPMLFAGMHQVVHAVGNWAAGAAAVLLPFVLAPGALGNAPTEARAWRRILLLGAAWAFLGIFCLAVLYAAWVFREHPVRVFGVSAALLGVTGFLDVNRISMYYFYRDRLSEAFVVKESGDPEDPVASNDDLPLRSALPRDRSGPYQLINTTANFPGALDPGLRARGCDFFLASPFHCGSRSTGYRPTEEYEDGDMPLASAMAISGAAANPQYGVHSSRAISLLLALFNARLGAWYENPRHDFRRVPRPLRRFWPYYLFHEVLGSLDEERRILNLSDGGHIENLGLYELLRRRCRVILISDAGADPEFTFEDLGRVVSMARIDLGVQVEDLDLRPLRIDPATGVAAARCATGVIHYPLPDGDYAAGLLVYVKSSLVASDSADLHAYRRACPAFPHESTADQFFEEAQFEAYRETGYLSGREAARLL